MPEGCLGRICRACEWYIIRSKRLECNFENRLGISKSGLRAFLGLSEKEVYERKRLDAVAEAKRLETLVTEVEPTEESDKK